MLTLPFAIEIELIPEKNAVRENVLVALDLHHGGQYYYGCHIGLTSSSGFARATREDIQTAFAADRRLFIMDYRVPLEECDPTIVIRIEGGKEFKRRQANVIDPTQGDLIVAAARQRWMAAQNGHLRPTTTSVRSEAMDADGVLRARIEVRPA